MGRARSRAASTASRRPMTLEKPVRLGGREEPGTDQGQAERGRGDHAQRRPPHPRRHGAGPEEDRPGHQHRRQGQAGPTQRRGYETRRRPARRQSPPRPIPPSVPIARRRDRQ